jgi:hypothetical protein
MFLDVGFDDVMVNAIKDLRNSGGDGGILNGDFNNIHRAFIIIAAAGVMFFIAKRYFEDQSTGRQFDISRYTKPLMILLFIFLYKPVMKVIDGFFDSMTNVTYKTNGRFMVFGLDVTDGAVSTLSGLLGNVIPGLGSSSSSSNKIGAEFDADYKGTDAARDKMADIMAATEGSGNTSNNLATINAEVTLGADQKDVSESTEKGVFNNLMKTLGSTINPLTKITAYVLLILMYACGPIALALSVWPGFESSLTNFFGTYIKISMWPALANLVSFLVYKIVTTPAVVATLTASNVFNNGKETSLHTIFFGSIFIAHTLVPMIANGLVGIGAYMSPTKPNPTSTSTGSNSHNGSGSGNVVA